MTTMIVKVKFFYY